MIGALKGSRDMGKGAGQEGCDGELEMSTDNGAEPNK